ncbi:sorbosone dehydrogenase family protein [Gulosibacter sp. 10]|uniref:PQQ-dependent sugar dehydrogenase n=1 Tax=Gulosibacter sp. 10 TaxID=1255570 RepID=UPI00097EF26C|nr:PQQ-dependent sugar dehydrogenase [Gulosibacter sp. 10]SJM59526.1 hypothetical protein FM112_06585 [Gulosibacter sp. 10]
MAGRRAAAALAVAAAVLLASCAQDAAPGGEGASGSSGPMPSQSAEVGAPSGLGEPTVLAQGLEAPWSIAFHGETALIAERDTARILELGADGGTHEVGVVPGVEAAGEGGLLGIAAHEGHLYVYSTGAGENRIERYELEGEPGALALGAGETLLDGIPAAATHNGGRIDFGPDGMLYATTGDAGDRPAAQDLDSLAGKILRLTPEGEVPADNPFEGSYVYSYGHRNPQGIAWAEDGTMLASEFGQDAWDELNVIEPGGNYGWPEVEGAAGDEAYVDPVQQWAPADASPSGIAIAAGSVYIGNLRGERLREVPLDDLGSAREHLVGEYGRLRDVTVAPDGALWVLTNETDGRGDPAAEDDLLLEIALR